MKKAIDEAIATYRTATTPAAIQREVRLRKRIGLPASAKDARDSALESLIVSLEEARS